MSIVHKNWTPIKIYMKLDAKDLFIVLYNIVLPMYLLN